MIKLVAFDLDDTLFNGTLLVKKARQAGIEMMQKYGFPLDYEFAIDLLNNVVKEYGSNSQNHYDYLFMKIQNHPEITLEKPLNVNKFISAGIIGYHREKVKHFQPFRDVKSNLTKLRKKGYTTMIITDGKPIKQYEKILRLKLADLVDHIIISDEVGVKKPNPLLLKIGLERANVKPEETIYIGDRLDRDVQPANELGIHSVLIHRGGKHDPNITGIKSPIKPSFHIHSINEIWGIIDHLNKQANQTE